MSPNKKPWCIRRSVTEDRDDDCGVPTWTSMEQTDVEIGISSFYEKFDIEYLSNNDIKLDRKRHVNFLKRNLKEVPRGYTTLDASRPWMLYWSLHGLGLLEEGLDRQQQLSIAAFLARCQSPQGGFGGGPGQDAHLAPTYAAVNALCCLDVPEALAVIDRQKLADFLSRMCRADGSFTMHAGGEADVRSVYCAAAVARLTRLATRPLFGRSADWLVRCQTYEGGFGGGPGMEAHGGYTFCGYAALALLGEAQRADTRALLRWATSRQMRYSGGFQGRTNKLVDGCYSFWQGGVFPLLHDTITAPSPDHWLFHTEALQNYLLLCCQSKTGGLLDKPGKSPDLYHSCYTLAGLSVAQNFSKDGGSAVDVVGVEGNKVAAVNPLHNVTCKAFKRAKAYFSSMPRLQPSTIVIEAESVAGSGDSAKSVPVIVSSLSSNGPSLEVLSKNNGAS